MGSNINMKKTKIRFNSCILDHESKIYDDVIECVQAYMCLRQKIGTVPDHEKELKRRIGMGWSAFGRQHNVMKSYFPLSLKRKIYTQCILPVVTYGPETWSLTKSLKRKLQSAQKRMERVMLGITWRDRNRAPWIREQTKVEDILSTLQRKKWSWAGRVKRRRNIIWTVKVTEWQFRDSKRRQGRQRTMLRDEIESFAEVTWNRQASDR